MRVTPTCDTINSIVVSDAMGIQRDPDIVFGAGVHFVVWGDARGGNSWIFGARVSPAGTVLDPSGIAISTESGEAPAIEYDGSRFLIAYSTTSSIKGVFCSSGGAPEDSVTIVSGGTSIYAPNIAFDGTNYLVIWIEWNGSAYEIHGQMVSPAGTLVGTQIVIGTTNIATKPGLCFDGNYYCISWTESNDIWARQYTTSGTPLGPAFSVSHHMDAQLFCDVASGVTKYLFTWGQVVSGDYDVYGNVDITVGVSENVPNAIPRYNLTTILAGPMPVFEDVECSIRDITGRVISDHDPAPGIYFVEINGKVTQKIIKIQ